MYRRSPLCALLVFVFAGCNAPLESPKPTLDNLEPALVCNDQLTTAVTVHGKQMTPVPFDVLTDKPRLILPDLTLTKVLELDGADSSAAPVDLFDDTRWIDTTTMEFDIHPDIALIDGIFDIEVTNPDGQKHTAHEALGSVPPPVSTAIDPNLLCLEQADQSAILSGQAFLVVGDTLPVVHIDSVDITPDDAIDCFDLAGPVAGRSCLTMPLTIPQNALGPGVYDITTTNPETAACTSTEELKIEFIPRPSLDSIVPDLSCVDQEDKTFALSGTHFLVLADGTLPMVHFGGYSASAETADSCAALAGPAGGELCTELTFILPLGAEDPGIHDVVVTNPPPADCFSTEVVQVELVPSPTLETFVPDLTCLEQSAQGFTLTGTGFIVLADGTTPTVAVGPYVALADSASSCTPLNGPAGGESCRILDIVLPIDAVIPDVHDVVVTNPAPAECFTVELVQVEAVRQPTLTDIVPALTCLEQETRDFILNGADFIVLADGTMPTVEIGSYVALADIASGCTPLSGPAGGEVCTTLDIMLPIDAETPGLHNVVITNPAPADCTTQQAVTLEAFTTPTLASIVDPLSCVHVAGGTFTLDGTEFIVVGGIHPTVNIGGFSAPATTVAGCTPLVGSGASEVCTQLTLDVLVGDLASGLQPVSVTNPDPVFCDSLESVDLEIIAPPSVVDIDPNGACVGAPGDTALTITGNDFVVVGATPPSVEVGGVFFNAPIATGCVPLTGAIAGQVCDTLDIVIPFGTFPLQGSYALIVHNPAPVDCSSSDPVTFDVSDPPIIDSVEPPQICDASLTITVRGTNFIASTEILIDGVAIATVFVSDTELTGTLPLGFGAGVYDVTVSNGSGCDDSLPLSLEIVDMPLIFFVDPPITYSQMQVQATVFVSGVNGPVTGVEIENATDGTITPVAFNYNPATPAVIQVTIPANLSSDNYHLRLFDNAYCDPELVDAFFVEDNPTLVLNGIDPPFGWTNGVTAVDVTADVAAGFENLPRVYLNPTVPGPATLATELRAVNFQDVTLLDAVVTDGLPVDTYDMIVINPSGEIGVLFGAFEVVANQPPVIDSVSPATFSSQSDDVAFITGSGFDQPLVTLDCTDPNSGAQFAATVTINSFSFSLIDVTVPSSSDGNLSGGAVCVVTVTNQTDNTYGTFAAISVTNPSQNLYDWRLGPDLNVARRAPAVAAGRVTRTSRFVWAMGGDDGAGLVYDSIERSKVGQFGDISSWQNTADVLPTPLTLAGVARLGRYIYLVGGNDGVTAVDTVWRAQILDPLAAPAFSPDLAVELGGGIGLGGGNYVYRVSALYDVTYDDNPGGESMASDPFVVLLPDIPDKLQLTLTWGEDFNAMGYRIYRSDTGSGGEEWLADVFDGTVTQYIDIGDPTDPLLTPVPAASLGEWSAMPPLARPLEAPCVAVAVDPSDPGVSYLYVAGGNDDTNTVRGEIAYLDIALVDEHDQDAGAWTTSAFALPAPRWQCGAFVAGSDLNPAVAPGDTWVYFGSGLDQGGGVETTVDGLLVGAGGEFAMAPQAVSDMKQRAGYVYAAVSDFLYALGGFGGGPDSGGESAQICPGGFEPQCSGPAPETKNWNALGTGALLVPRYLPGSAQESSVIFAVGGDDGSGATTSVEYTNF